MISAQGKTAHHPSKVRYIRNKGGWLKAGDLAAHARFRLMLLGSPPDMVHEFTLRKTGPSTLPTNGRRYITVPWGGIHSCCSGLQVQGTANSPISAALPRADIARGKTSGIIHYYFAFSNNFKK